MTTRFSKVVRRSALGVAVALVAPLGIVGATAAPAAADLPTCTTTWTDTAGGSWDTPASWSGGTVPGIDDHACITTPGTYTVTLADPGDPVEVASLRVGGTDATTTQTLVVARGVNTDEVDSLYADEGIEVSTRGVIELGESATAGVSLGSCGCAGIVNAGTIRQAAGSAEVHQIWADVVNTGTIHLTQPLYVEGDLTNDGEGLLQVDHVLHVRDTMWTKGGEVRGEWVVAVYGELLVGEGDTDRAAGAPPFNLDASEHGAVGLAIEADSPIDVTAMGYVFVEGDSHPEQSIAVQPSAESDGALLFEDAWTNGGYLALQPDADFDAVVAGAAPGTTLVNEGELVRFDPDGGAALVAADLVNRGAVATEDGVLDVYGDVENEGFLDLGLGRIRAGGDVLLDPTSTVEVAVAGASTTERLLADGDVTVDGRLIVDTGTAPAVGETVRLVEGATRTGTFDQLTLRGPASYDVAYTTRRVNLVRRASETPSQRFVRAAYEDFLDRAPTPSELGQRSSAIDAGTLTRGSLVRELARTPEYVSVLVRRFYADTLGRPGDAAGIAYWVDELRSGRRSVAEVAGSFYASREYFVRAGGSNQAWITDLYDVFFDRPPSPADVTWWTARVGQRGRTRVAMELFQSLESRRERVDALYWQLLDRPGDSGGIEYWAGRITREGDLALAVHLAASPEYLSRAQARFP